MITVERHSYKYIVWVSFTMQKRTPTAHQTPGKS
nr:MAG TPA: hypothetical protein [Caudoviricetes sp.]